MYIFPKNWKQILYTYVHSTIFHNSSKVEATQMYIDKWMGKQNVVYTYNGINAIQPYRGNAHTCYNMMNLEDTMQSEVSQLQRDDDCIPLRWGI